MEFFAKKFLLISDFAARLGSNIVIADHPEILKELKRIAFKAYYIPYGSNHCLTDFNSLSKNDISGVLKKYKLEDLFFTSLKCVELNRKIIFM